MILYREATNSVYINTKEQHKVSVALKNKGKVIKSLSAKNKFGSQVLLSLIKKIVDTSDIKGIEVETGPGSFTGLRVGVSVANALGFALNIPVNGKKIETELNY